MDGDGHLLNGRRGVGDLRGLRFATLGQVLGRGLDLVGRRTDLQGGLLHTADDVPELADHKVERVSDSAGEVGRHLGLYSQVALGHAADLVQQLHD